MRIATWNVNSIRSRIDRVEAFLQRQDVDVLALQETKCKDEQFPEERLTALGYEVAHHGLSQWNGVALISRVGLEDVQVGFDGMPHFGDPLASEARALGGTCGGVRVWSLYVPNGRALGDPHMDYKLEWLERLRATAGTWVAQDPAQPVALVGDWNVAPQDEDVWDMAFFEGKTHVSRAASGPPSRRVLDAGFTDVVRPHTPGPGHLHLLGLHPAALPRSGRACGSTSCSAHRRSPAGSRPPPSTVRSARARAPATTRR